MTLPKVSTIAQMLDEFAPRKLAESWDNVGLLIGDGSKPVSKLLISLDVPEWVVEEAIEKNVDMIICHHPMIFHSLKRITRDDPTGRKILRLVQHGISVYAMHTNYDSTVDGMNDSLMESIGLTPKQTIEQRSLDKLYKLVVYIPESHSKQVEQAIFSSGAGAIGNYYDCGFEILGTGTFIPGDETVPYIGTPRKKEYVKEIRFETVVKSSNLSKVIKNMLKAHPYEEVAYDIIPLENKLEKFGLGKLGELENSLSLIELGEVVKSKLQLDSVKVIGDREKPIKKVAIIGGSGADYWQKAKTAGADVLITGDVDYHTMLDAIEGGMTLLDAGHFGTEKIIMTAVEKKLTVILAERGYSEVSIEKSTTNVDISYTI